MQVRFVVVDCLGSSRKLGKKDVGRWPLARPEAMKDLRIRCDRDATSSRRAQSGSFAVFTQGCHLRPMGGRVGSFPETCEIGGTRCRGCGRTSRLGPFGQTSLDACPLRTCHASDRYTVYETPTSEGQLRSAC